MVHKNTKRLSDNDLIKLIAHLYKYEYSVTYSGYSIREWNFIALQKVNTLQLNTASNSSNTRRRPTRTVSEHSLL
jgi:hypothetical protein